jgi:hypothetical protein
MSDQCPYNIDLIDEEENIGNSLSKINNNFNNLQSATCNIKQQIDNLVAVRTFFYYGPNAPTDSEVGSWEQDNTLSRPSDGVIENFVNSDSQLNLPSISQLNDVVFVIYQKTGWYSDNFVHFRSGSLEQVNTRTVVKKKKKKSIGIGYKKIKKYKEQSYTTSHGWSTAVNDTYNFYTPVFVIYRLTFKDNDLYVMDSGFPKYTRAATSSTTNWNNPSEWSTY